VKSESVARRSAVIDPIREISVDVAKRVIDKYCTVRQAHNLKVTGSNPVPATRHQALENASFSRAFCARILARNFVRGSVVEAAGGKRQRKIDGARRCVMTQL
jgi:hypothetical protein